MQLNAATSQFKVLAHALISEGCVRGEADVPMYLIWTSLLNVDFHLELNY